MIHLRSVQEILKSKNSIRLALFEAQRHIPNDDNNNRGYKYGEAALYEWERTEEGSIVDMIAAYQYVFNVTNLNESLSIDVINHIRSQMANARTYGNEGVKKLGVNHLTSASEDRCFSIPNCDKARYEQLKTDSNTLQYSIKSMLGDEMPETPYDVQCDSYNNVTIRGVAGGTSKKYYDAIIDRYNNNMKNETSEDKKLENIIELARDLERVHPYPDFNCRTFCVLILNRELIKNNLQLSIIEDPNVFDYQNMEELKESVACGQKNFEYLKEHGIVHENDPSDEKLFDYFKKAAELEISNIERTIKEDNQYITELTKKLNETTDIETQELLQESIKNTQQIIQEALLGKKELQEWTKKGDELKHKIDNVISNKSLEEEQHSKSFETESSSQSYIASTKKNNILTQEIIEQMHKITNLQQQELTNRTHISCEEDQIRKEIKDKEYHARQEIKKNWAVIEPSQEKISKIRNSPKKRTQEDMNKKKEDQWSQDFVDLGSLSPSPTPSMKNANNKHKHKSR